MILKTQIKNSLVSFDNLEHTHLSLQISLDGMGICIFDKDLIDVILLHYYEFETRAHNPKELLDKVKGIFRKETLLSKNYESISVTHRNNLSAIVPETLYDKTKHLDYLKYSVRVLENDPVTVDEITEMNSKNVFIPFENINEFLVDTIGNFEYHHTSSVLVGTLLKKYRSSTENHFFVNVNKTSLDIVFIEEGHLHLYNNFLYSTKEDFLYYILFAMEQLKLNPDSQPLVFIGDIDEDSDLYQLAYNYIRNISFLDVQNYSLSEEFYSMNPHIKKHQYFELLNQH